MRMDTEAATTVLTIVGTSFGAIMAALVMVMFASIRLQHRDSAHTRELVTNVGMETRDLIDEARKENQDLIDKARKENRSLIDETRKETRDLIDKNRDLIDKNRDLIERNHGVVISLLGDTRERLARIERSARRPGWWPPLRRLGGGRRGGRCRGTGKRLADPERRPGPA